MSIDLISLNRHIGGISLTDGYQYARIDQDSGCLLNMDYSHHAVHEGEYFLYEYSILADTDDTMEVRIQAPASPTQCHYVLSIDSALAATAQIWNPTTKTDVSGNRLTALNHNFNSSVTSALTVCHTPGGSQAGDANLTQYLGSASTGGRIIVGGATGSREEFIFKYETAFLIKLTSRVDGNALTFIMSGYEHTPKDQITLE